MRGPEISQHYPDHRLHNDAIPRFIQVAILGITATSIHGRVSGESDASDRRAI